MRLIDADIADEIIAHAENEWNLAMAAADGNREINRIYKMQELCRAVRGVMNSLPTIELQPQWIPVTDRLPEIHNTVLVFARYNGQSANSMHIKHDAITTNFRDSRGEWIYMGKGYHVEAWMPLPEPYTPVGKDE